MPQYNYKAKKKDGQIFQGVVESAAEEEAVAVLRDRNLEVLFLEPVSRLIQKKARGYQFTFIKPHVKRKDIVIFARQLSVMISANLSVVEALRIIVAQTEKEGLKETITNVADEVESGTKLSVALERQGKTFSHFFVSMIQSGETSGKLDEVLEYLADQEEKDYDLVAKIKGAMIYPIFIISGLVLVGAAMMIFVIPQLTAMLTASGATLPFTTRVLIGTSNFMRGYWWLLIIIIAGVVFGFKALLRTSQGRYAFDLIKLKFPVFGNLFKMIYLVRFTQSLSTLTRGGVPLTAGLRIVSDVVGNNLYQALINRTIKEVEDGNSVAVVFLESPLVPKLVSQMLSVGEKSGRMDQVLDKVSGFYGREIENMVANMTHLIEPFIMVLIGIAVGGMVASIILPMYNLANQF
ncbi:MAG: type II secretion system F family protein [Candidatus Komeilibacteria bacterium]|nr:type II secretion system F family protein [Candidatus Komeilibacteria bacterium]